MYGIYVLVVFVSEISLVRFLIRQQLVRKYRTPTLSMKYSLSFFFILTTTTLFSSFAFVFFDNSLTDLACPRVRWVRLGGSCPVIKEKENEEEEF